VARKLPNRSYGTPRLNERYPTILIPIEERQRRIGDAMRKAQ
jgi:hypothetical protein